MFVKSVGILLTMAVETHIILHHQAKFVLFCNGDHWKKRKGTSTSMEYTTQDLSLLPSTEVSEFCSFGWIWQPRMHAA